MKKPINSIHISCYDLDVYRIRVERGYAGHDVRHYSVRSESVAFDYISKLVNDGKVRQRVQLSVYPSFHIRPIVTQIKQTLTKANYDGEVERQELCQFIKEHLGEIYPQIANARKNEMSFAPSDIVDPQDFDNLFHVIAAVYRECDRVEMDSGAEDEYGYSEQGKSFD